MRSWTAVGSSSATVEPRSGSTGGTGRRSSLPSWPTNSGSAAETRAEPGDAPGTWTRPRMRAVASSVFYPVLIVIVLFPRMWASVSTEVELRAARVASPTSYPAGLQPRHDPMFGSEELRGERRHSTSSGAGRQPTSRHGHRSLGLTRPASLSDPGPISLSAGVSPVPMPPHRSPSLAAAQAGFSSIPCPTGPSSRYFQSATRSFLASATTMTLRSRPREPPERLWNQRERAHPGW